MISSESLRKSRHQQWDRDKLDNNIPIEPAMRAAAQGRGEQKRNTAHPEKHEQPRSNTKRRLTGLRHELHCDAAGQIVTAAGQCDRKPVAAEDHARTDHLRRQTEG